LRVRAVRFIDPGYPRLLSEIPPPLAILYVRGEVTAEDEWALAVVGTRRASAYGRQMTERLVQELAAQRITIVSELARGIDTHALAAALDAGGRTIAVLGCGPDLVYPPENAKFAARIVEQGAVVTEFACRCPRLSFRVGVNFGVGITRHFLLALTSSLMSNVVTSHDNARFFTRYIYCKSSCSYTLLFWAARWNTST
jgi:hypothetical protein